MKSKTSTYGSSRPEVFYKKDVLRNFGKLTEKHLCQSLLLNFIKKRESVTGDFLWILRISKNTFSYRTSPMAASVCE